MTLQFTIKDIIYILVYVVSVVGFIASFKYKITRIEEKIALFTGVLFQKEGTLNLINQTTCREHRNNIHEKIRHEAAVAQESFKELEEPLKEIKDLSRNVLRIMIHMEIEPHKRDKT